MVADFAFYRKIGRQIWQLSRAFEHNFGLKGREFERNNQQKSGEGMSKLPFDRRISFAKSRTK